MRIYSCFSVVVTCFNLQISFHNEKNQTNPRILLPHNILVSIKFKVIMALGHYPCCRNPSYTYNS